MFELPEFVTLARQMNETLQGKLIRAGSLGNSPHKFVWYNRSPQEFAALTQGKRVGSAQARGKWLFLPLDPGYVLLFGECGGRLLFHPPGARLPDKQHLAVEFDDGSCLSAMTQMWGAYELYERGQEQERTYVKGMRPTPLDASFTADYLASLIDSLATAARSVKSLLTQEQLIPGLGNAIAQDILFHARLHPRHSIQTLDHEQRRRLHAAIQTTVQDVIALGGRSDEVDLYGRPGGYVRLMSSQTMGQPCPGCGATIEKLQYLGGANYFCAHCQT